MDDIMKSVLYNKSKELVTVKVKYIDKRHWRRIVDREYVEVKVNNNKFKGIIGLVTMKKVREPLEVSVVGQKITVADDNYQWLQILPEKKRYSITVMIDSEGNPLEYYFDINIKNITQKGNARTLDLFLDVLVLPNGEYELVDEEDLQRALEQGQITRQQYHEAYVIAHQLMIKIDKDFPQMQEKIMYCFHKIKHKKPTHKPNKFNKVKPQHKKHPRHKENKQRES
jgi:predicted RNA-binding protein associated with RNAse of E/G family